MDDSRGLGLVPLRTRIAEALRGRILDGSLAPGSPLVELRIAAELKVSRAPVREAIRILAREGLVDTVSYKGSTVRSLSARDLQEATSLRAALAGFAAATLADRRPAPAPAPVDAALTRLRAAVARADAAEAEAAERDFLDALVGAADHGLLDWVWGLLRLRAASAPAGSMAATRRRLRLLVQVRDAIGQGDAARARDLLAGGGAAAAAPAAKPGGRSAARTPPSKSRTPRPEPSGRNGRRA